MSIHNPLPITASPTLTGCDWPAISEQDRENAARPDIAAFADTLAETDELYWPALAASDGCEASLAELNAMLEAMDCEPFACERSTWGMGS